MVETAVEEKQQTQPEAKPLEFTRDNQAKNLFFKGSLSLYCPCCTTVLAPITKMSMRGGRTILKCGKCGHECWTDMRLL